MGSLSGGSINTLLGHEQGNSFSGSHSPFGCLIPVLPPGPGAWLEPKTLEWHPFWIPFLACETLLVSVPVVGFFVGPIPGSLALDASKVPFDIQPVGFGFIANAFPVRAIFPSSKNSPTHGKDSGMHPSVSSTALETSTMFPSMTYTIVLASTHSCVSWCSPLTLAKNTPRFPAVKEFAQLRLISDGRRSSIPRPRPGR